MMRPVAKKARGWQDAALSLANLRRRVKIMRRAALVVSGAT